VLSGLRHINFHHLNATDAILLAVLLHAKQVRFSSDMLILVTADKRLVRAAEAEGIRTIDPESATDEEIAALMRGT
jgi:predicted nucleic acid-binding protein